MEVGMALRDRCGGTQLAFVDPRRNDDTGAMVGSARRLVRLFRARGMSQEQIVISVRSRSPAFD